MRGNGLQRGLPAALFGTGQLARDGRARSSRRPTRWHGPGSERPLASVPFLSQPGIVRDRKSTIRSISVHLGSPDGAAIGVPQAQEVLYRVAEAGTRSPAGLGPGPFFRPFDVLLRLTLAERMDLPPSFPACERIRDSLLRLRRPDRQAIGATPVRLTSLLFCDPEAETPMPLYPLGISRRRDVAERARADGRFRRRRLEPCGRAGMRLHRCTASGRHADAPRRISMRSIVASACCRCDLAWPCADEADLHAMLDGRRDQWLDRLGQLEATCEMGLQIVRSAPAEKRRPAMPTASRPCAVGAGSMPGCPASGTRDAAASDRQSPLAYVEAATIVLSAGRRRRRRPRPVDRAALRRAAARLLPAVAKAAVFLVVPSPTGVPRRAGSRRRLSEPLENAREAFQGGDALF